MGSSNTPLPARTTSQRLSSTPADASTERGIIKKSDFWHQPCNDNVPVSVSSTLQAIWATHGLVAGRERHPSRLLAGPCGDDCAKMVSKYSLTNRIDGFVDSVNATSAPWCVSSPFCLNTGLNCDHTVARVACYSKLPGISPLAARSDRYKRDIEHLTLQSNATTS
jgi:hypothetical protein